MSARAIPRIRHSTRSPEYAGVSRDTAIRAVNVGKKIGLLIRVKGAGKKGLGGTSNRYGFRLKEVADTLLLSEAKEVAGELLKRSQACIERGSRRATQPSKDHLKDLEAPPSSSGLNGHSSVGSKEGVGEKARWTKPIVYGERPRTTMMTVLGQPMMTMSLRKSTRLGLFRGAGGGLQRDLGKKKDDHVRRGAAKTRRGAAGNGHDLQLAHRSRRAERIKADRQEPLDLAASIPRRARKQSVVPRQGIMLAVFRVVPKINIKFLSEFWVQTADILGISGCRPFDHILIIT